LHDHISQVLFLYTLSSAPNSRVINVLHLRNLYESKSCHVVIQSFSFRNGQTHLMNNRIDLGIVLNLGLGLEVNGSIRWRAFFDTDGLERGQIFLLDVPQSVTVASKADSQQLF
jgi:hypothetical protein